MIAANASEIVEMRKIGKQPASWVLVSFVGNLPCNDDGFTAFAKPEREYDWRWLVGLDVIVFVRKGLDVAHQLKAIRNERPKSLSLWDVDSKTGAEVQFDFPMTHAEAHRKATRKALSIDLAPWPLWQCKEFIGMGY